MSRRPKVVVTGASRGIGRAIAQRLAAEGYRVIGTYNTSVDEAETMRQSHGIDMRQVDLSQREQTLEFAVEMIAEGDITALVNNAGIIEFEPFETLTLESWDRVLEVNLTAPLLLSQRLAPAMKAGGAIINVASTDGYIGSFSSISYAASKAALISLTKSLANVLGGKGLRVVAVTPGWINTGMATDESYDAVQLTPLGRNGKPEEVGNLVAFLLTDQASFISGSSIVIDGGYTGVDYIMKKESESLG